MKWLNSLCLLLVMSTLGMLLGGCLIKPVRVPTRYFVLAPIQASEQAPTTGQQSAVEVGVVRMPPYLLRDSMVIRRSTNEVEYLKTALWAERLDQSFRQTLAKNLARLLASDRSFLPTSERDRGGVRISVNVDQFDVDTEGRGTLLADWRLTRVGSDKPIRSGQAQLIQPGPPPRANPQAVATTLSALVERFSRHLAQALREPAQAR